jgi:putative endopeptidase
MQSVRIREFYLDDNYQSKRQDFLLHATNILRLLEDPNPEEAAAAVLATETFLANSSRSAADRRDPEKSFNLVTMAELRHLTKGVFDWVQYFTLLQVPPAAWERIIIRDVDFFASLPDFLTFKQGNRLALSSYFRFRLALSFSSLLPEAFRNESFAISKSLYGIKTAAPRDQVCASLVDSNLGELIGRLYVLHHFPPSSVSKAKTIIENVERAFEAAINATTWLDANTSSLALGKLRAIANKVGYPDKWEDYSNLMMSKDSIIANVLAVRAVSHFRDVALLNGTVPRHMWLMNAHTVNAYYNPSWNEIVITAGILQPPFFDPDWPDALNYGGIGTIIGHELTHGFDDEGRKYDKDGILREWWPKSVVDAYSERAKCTENVYETYTVSVGNDTLHPDGSLTLGENIADCGGMKHAYYAWRSVYDSKSREEQAKDQTAAKKFFKLENADQLFFVGFGQRDCERIRDDALRIELASDPHSPGYARIRGPASNFAEFSRVFNCPAGSPMNPSHKCTVW